MKNFWHYMESVQEDREIEVQNESGVWEWLSNHIVIAITISDAVGLTMLLTILGYVAKTMLSDLFEKFKNAKNKITFDDTMREKAKELLINKNFTIDETKNVSVENEWKTIIQKVSEMSLEEKKTYKSDLVKAIKAQTKEISIRAVVNSVNSKHNIPGFRNIKINSQPK